MNDAAQRQDQLSQLCSDGLVAFMSESFPSGAEPYAFKIVSNHARGQTFRLSLSDGEVLFVKRDRFTSFKEIMSDLTSLRAPRPKTFKERWAMQQLTQLGIAVPEVIAHAQQRRWGLPYRAVILMRPLPGVPLDEWLEGSATPACRTAVFRMVGDLARRAYGSSLSMPDFVPRHVFVREDGQVGILDVERVHRRRWGLRRKVARQVERFCRLARQAGAGDAEIAAFHEGLTPGRQAQNA